MKKTLLLTAVLAATLLSGCIVVPARGYRAYDAPPPPAGPRYYRDRDRDGVPDRYDARPGNPYRY